MTLDILPIRAIVEEEKHLEIPISFEGRNEPKPRSNGGVFAFAERLGCGAIFRPRLLDRRHKAL